MCDINKEIHKQLATAYQQTLTRTKKVVKKKLK